MEGQWEVSGISWEVTGKSLVVSSVRGYGRSLVAHGKSLEGQINFLFLLVFNFWNVQILLFGHQSYGPSMSIVLRRYTSVIDKSLDLEKISRRNDSYFSLSSRRIVFSFLFLFSIFKIFRLKISFFSWFARLLNQFSFSSQFSRLWNQKSLPTLDSWDSVLCFSFSSCEIFLTQNYLFLFTK